eukprot:CAMPEP_0172362312 /NCGR_PEP_ID=MMETSP1060-20121228/5940_1 /TAXON_ID=37318 /ORGANISM="Pseudo-nitzschia pungens, Strain cf. cingulata" /LENGTH=124 /DNA_ID=CAMNT_0013084787 /DNA_START=2395 /DNA_END=2769 /DNA_ORIENTATION=+
MDTETGPAPEPETAMGTGMSIGGQSLLPSMSSVFGADRNKVRRNRPDAGNRTLSSSSPPSSLFVPSTSANGPSFVGVGGVLLVASGGLDSENCEEVLAVARIHRITDQFIPPDGRRTMVLMALI